MGKTGVTVGTLKATGAFGGPAWILSAVLHASVAAAVFAHPLERHEPKVMEIIEILPTVDPPPPAEVPEPLPPPPPQQLDQSPPQVAPPPLAKAPPPIAAIAASSTPPRSVPAPPAATAAVSALTTEAQGEAPAVVATSAGPTFVMALPVGSTPHVGARSSGTLEVVDERAVSRRAAVAYGPVPVYPRAARAAQVETDVPVEIIVNELGSVIDARVTSHLGYGLEEATLDAIRRYRFTPAQRDGHPVAVRMIWTMQYRLQ